MTARRVRIAAAGLLAVVGLLAVAAWALDLQQAIPVSWFVRDERREPVLLDVGDLTRVVAATMTRYGGMPRDAHLITRVRARDERVASRPRSLTLVYVPEDQKLWRYFVLAEVTERDGRPVVLWLDRHWEPPVVRALARWWYDRTAPLAPVPASVRANCRVDLAAVRRITGQRFSRLAPMWPSDDGMIVSGAALREWSTRTGGSSPDGVVVRWRTPWRPSWDPSRRIEAEFIRRSHDEHGWNVVVLRSPRIGAKPPTVEGVQQTLDESPCVEGKPGSGA